MNEYYIYAALAVLLIIGAFFAWKIIYNICAGKYIRTEEDDDAGIW